MVRLRIGAALAVLIPTIAACASRPPGDDWARYEVAAAGRVLAAASPSGTQHGDVLTVFIEGDGDAHDAVGRPSSDPTPRRAVSMDIAMAWPAVGPRVWLGRLCQYVRDRDPACTPGDWTLDRFSPAAVGATNVALDQLKARAQSARIVLVGWSGGGTLAALVAAQRSDIDALVTIAAPLDLAAWTTQMRISPLPAEGDPARVVTVNPAARWVHLHGGRDGVVRAQPQIEAARSLGAQALLWPGETHACCWARRAGEIAELIRPPAP